MHPSHSLIIIRAAKRPTPLLLYSDSLPRLVLLIVTLCGVWVISWI
ncbi:BgTH12-06997 [Blumeria graminis f. sp. triticale]|uniref:Bgt-51901 n=2 Tax=Blumeria graminis TaxID=34373 RepID=A0A9X9MPA6_BLUGR|nr:BgTH12-06997 [Blumeria graminis f. sp. triticale]VDB94724.1 Bgt-51901 [Blumeria graminis f. sp. tritici]